MRRQSRGTNRDGRAYPQRLRLFRSDLLERLTVMSPGAFALTWAALLLLVLWTVWGTVSIAVGIGLVMGGTQALSRSFFSQLVPRGREAELASKTLVDGQLMRVESVELLTVGFRNKEGPSTDAGSWRP